MRLAFVGPAHPYRGGIAHFNARLARQMSQSDECLIVNFTRLYPRFLFPGKTQFDRSSTEIGFPSRRLIDSLNPLSWRRAANEIRGWKADAVVFHYWHPFFAPAYRTIACYLRKSCPTIAICHNVTPHIGNPPNLPFNRRGGEEHPPLRSRGGQRGGFLQSRLTRAAFAAMSGFVVHARSEVDDLLRLGAGARRKVPAFHPLYDVFPDQDIPREEARRRLGLDPAARVVLYFGLIRRYKGVDLLLEAIKELGDVPDLKVLIVGEVYSDRERLAELLRGLPPGRADLIDRYVPNEEVAQYFRAADLVVLPYRSATQSGVVPIAYACDRPVVVTNVGGLPDSLLEGRSGYLVGPEDPAAIAGAIRRHFVLLGSPDLSEGIAEMRRRLSWERYAELLRGLILELKGGNGG